MQFSNNIAFNMSAGCKEVSQHMRQGHPTTWLHLMSCAKGKETLKQPGSKHYFYTLSGMCSSPNQITNIKDKVF